MEGSGAGSGGGDQRNKDIEGRSSSRGNVFGVDGVSKTGSTAQDAAIGFTSGEGTGKAGANFAALEGATKETVDKAVAASQAAQQQGASIAGQQQAAGAALGVTQPSSSVQQALAAQQTQGAPVPESRLNLMNIVQAPTPDELTMGTEPFSSSSLASLLTEAVQTPAVDVSGVTNMALARGISNPVYEAELNRRALAGDQEAKTLFDNALVKGYMINPFNYGLTDTVPEDTLGVDVFEEGDIAGDLALNPQLLDGPPVTLADAQAAILADAQPAISADRVLAPAQVGPPAAQMQQIGPATQAAQGEFYGEDLQQPDIFGTPGGEFTGLYGFPDSTAQGEFLTQAMRPSKAASQLMNLSLLSQGIGALTGKDPSEAALEGGRQSLRDIFAAGGQFNPETGRVEAQLPSGQLQMNKMGMVTYSGMPDPNYTGPFANLVNPPEQERGGPVPIASVIEEEPVVDPCPPGFALVDGVCQPTQQTGGTTTGVPNPPVPPVFQPTYQPFQPQPLNPFVLSPTGAAIGRSV